MIEGGPGYFYEHMEASLSCSDLLHLCIGKEREKFLYDEYLGVEGGGK